MSIFRFFKRWLPAKDEVKNPKTASRQALEMLRREYTGSALLEKHVSEDPFSQFSDWFDDALKTVKTDPNAMILSTADEQGRPSSRTVLLKGFDENGFLFYTNYKSRKASQISANSQVSLTFYWPELMRQVHIEGKAEKVSEQKSDDYFKTRPESSQLSAWASSQSNVLSSRKELEKKLKEVEERFKNKPVPRPPNWGGFRVMPRRIEFWQGRLNRLHDRICYTKSEKGWEIKRLSP